MTSKRIFYCGLPFVVGLWVLYGFLAANRLGIAESGQWGDTFGALNALFTGMAFLGVIATLQDTSAQARASQRANVFNAKLARLHRDKERLVALRKEHQSFANTGTEYLVEIPIIEGLKDHIRRLEEELDKFSDDV